jgi:TPR repeat protein
MLSLVPASAHELKGDLNDGLAAARAGDYAVARSVWVPLARHGSAEAQFRLGWLFESGLGTKKNPADAVNWYRKAAAQGHPSAQFNLGMMYTDGRGVLRDDITAANFFRMAARQGHAKAAYNLGIFYQTGRGVEKDPGQARYWFGRAKANGLVKPKKAGLA